MFKKNKGPKTPVQRIDKNAPQFSNKDLTEAELKKLKKKQIIILAIVSSLALIAVVGVILSFTILKQ